MTNPNVKKSESPKRLVNHSAWIGPVVVFAGAVSYFLVFARFPVLRDFPWLNLPIVAAGVIVSVLGVRHAIARRAGANGRFVSGIGLFFSVGVSALFCFYVFNLSYQVPKPTKLSLNLSQAPEFALSDQDGKQVRLSDFRGRKLILTFYRGHW